VESALMCVHPGFHWQVLSVPSAIDLKAVKLRARKLLGLRLLLLCVPKDRFERHCA
jgi:hypothetical protein